MWVVQPPNSNETTPLFHRFGGHAHAVGFSLPSDSLPLLRARISTYATPRLTGPLLAPALAYDAELPLTSINPELFTWIGRCAPFGIGNTEPIFLTRNATLAAPIRLIKERHICLQLSHAGAQTHPTISALGWSRGPAETSSWAARCARLNLGQGSTVDILYRLKKNTGPYSNGHPDGLELELCDLRSTAASQP